MREHLVRFCKSDWGVMLLLAVGWQVLMTLLGFALARTFGAGNNVANLASHTLGWDGGWYMSIINFGYAGSDPQAQVFYPLWPFTIDALLTLTRGVIDVAVIGLAVNTVALWLALVALLRIGKHFVGKLRWWAVGLFLVSPAAIYLHMFYTEAMFCAIAFWAYWFALQRRWGYMALLLALLTSVRLPAILFIGLCALEFWRAHGWNIRKALNRQVLWFLLTPAGVLAYALYLYASTGDALGMMHGYHAGHDWSYHHFNPNVVGTMLMAVAKCGYVVLHFANLTPQNVVQQFLPVAALGLLLAASLYALREDRLRPLGIFGLASLVFYTLNDNVVSVHRYVLPCLVLYVAAAVLIAKKPRWAVAGYGALYVSALLQVYLVALFVSGNFAG